MNSREAVAYLKGLLEGAPPADEGEKRLFDAIFCAIDSLSLELQELKQRVDEGEKVYSDVLDSCLRLEDEMSDLHDEVDLLKRGEGAEGVEEDYEEFYASLTCPACGHSFYYQPDEYEEGEQLQCPSCGGFFDLPRS